MDTVPKTGPYSRRGRFESGILARTLRHSASSAMGLPWAFAEAGRLLITWFAVFDPSPGSHLIARISKRPIDDEEAFVSR